MQLHPVHLPIGPINHFWCCRTFPSERLDKPSHQDHKLLLPCSNTNSDLYLNKAKEAYDLDVKAYQDHKLLLPCSNTNSDLLDLWQMLQQFSFCPLHNEASISFHHSHIA